MYATLPKEKGRGFGFLQTWVQIFSPPRLRLPCSAASGDPLTGPLRASVGSPGKAGGDLEGSSRGQRADVYE